nr:conserved uncharacterized protein [uncultured bacterium]
MPLTLDPIPNASPFAPFATDVAIFANTKAREAPARLTAIAQALKAHVNGAWLGVATAFLNTTVVALNAALAAIQTFVNGLETQINDRLAEFETNLGAYLDVGAGYAVGAINNALFTGALASGAVTYDADGRLTEIDQGPRRIHAIVYNADGFLASYAETLTLSDLPTTRVYSFTYDASGNLASITET